MNSSLNELKEDVVQSLFWLAVDLSAIHSANEMRNMLIKILEKSTLYLDTYYDLIDNEDTEI